MTTTRPSERPPGFDAALVAYLPMLRRKAKYMAGSRSEDLLQETIVDMLILADRCRMATFRTWAQLVMVRAAHKYKRFMGAQRRTGVHMPETAAYGIGHHPEQEDYADLSAALRTLASIRDGDALVREAMGDTLTEMGEERGISREAMRQRREIARNRLKERMAA